MPYLDPAQAPSVFGVSGYSGAGTKSGEKDEEGRPKTVPKIVSATQRRRHQPGVLVIPHCHTFIPSIASPTVLRQSCSCHAMLALTTVDFFPSIRLLTPQGPSDLRGGIRPYALTDHIHERESAFRLSTLPSSPSPFSLAFIPNVAPWFSGIISVLTAPLNQSMRASNVVELYEQQYSGERMCIVGKGVPDVTEAEGRHGWRMGGVQVHSSGKRVVVVVS